MTATVIGGRFELREVIGGGSYGEVFAARDFPASAPHTHAPYAVKSCRYSADDPTPYCIVRECCALNALGAHVNIVRVHTWVFECTHAMHIAYLVLERASGDLHTLLYKAGASQCAAPIPLALHIARAVQHAHDRGVVHCDIKPANILVYATNNPRMPRLVLADFGMARFLVNGDVADPASLSLADASARDIGSGPTHWYRAPELFFYEIARVKSPMACDVWAWGATVYELFRRRALYGGDDSKVDATALPVLARIFSVIGSPQIPGARASSSARAWPMLAESRDGSALAQFVLAHVCEPSDALACSCFAPSRVCACTKDQARAGEEVVTHTQYYDARARIPLPVAIDRFEAVNW